MFYANVQIAYDPDLLNYAADYNVELKDLRYDNYLVSGEYENLMNFLTEFLGMTSAEADIEIEEKVNESNKITRKQLRNFIKEGMHNSNALDDVITDAVYDYLVNMYSVSDPVMAKNGIDSWKKQVLNAVNDLSLRIYDDVENVEDLLFDGQYF